MLRLWPVVQPSGTLHFTLYTPHLTLYTVHPSLHTLCQRCCVTKWHVTMLCAKDSVWQSCVWKMVCDKVVCERWWVKDSVSQSGVWKMVCHKVVTERWCVTKLCVKDGMWQSGVWKIVWKMVCDKVVCERLCERWCVRVGVWKTFRGITPHPLANRFAPNPNGRCSPLSFRSLFFSICLPLFMFFQGFLPAISSFSQRFPWFPWFFQAVFPGGFSQLATYLFLQLKGFFTIFLCF